MIPVYQTLTTVNDGKGNCFIACVASLMELPLRELPNLANDLNGGQYFLALEKWMEPRGLFPTHHTTMPQGWSIAGVYMGEERLPHAVVAFNGKTVHDPHPLPGNLGDADSWWTLDPISNEQRQTVRSSAPQEPVADDDARLARWFAGQLSDQAHQCRKVKWVAQASLYGDASDFLERIANRLQAKAGEG